jgi:hypothetical protein
MRKYLDVAIIGSGLGLIRLLGRSARGPRNLRLAFSWIGWGVGTAVAVGTVRSRSRRALTSTRPD